MQGDLASPKERFWCKTQYSNLIRYVPSGKYYARVRVKGKLIVKSLKTTRISVAKLRLSDLEKAERTTAENNDALTSGSMCFGQALAIFRQRVDGDPSLKPRTKAYYGERIAALLKSWPELDRLDLRKLSKTECLNWAAKFGVDSSSSAFNHTISVLKHVIEVGIEVGARYDNPARSIKRRSEKPKKLQLPDFSQFERFVTEIENSGSGFSKPCADLVRFLAFGGFRITEAKNVTGADIDFKRGKIAVWGDPLTRTKNGEFREVPMIPEMRMLLEKLKSENPAAAPEAPVMQVHECQKAMDRAAKVVGMKRITHHDLRHLFATRCIESGVDIPTVSRWLGHKDGGALAMKTYGHLRDEHSAAMAQKVVFTRRAVQSLDTVRIHG